MSDRATADDFNGKFDFPLPIQGYAEYGWHGKGLFGIEGNWEVRQSTDNEKFPTVVIDQDNDQFVIATYPRGNHDSITEAAIAHSTCFGTFMVVEMFQKVAKDWISPSPDEMFQKDDFQRVRFQLESVNYGSLNPDTTRALISKNPDGTYGTAFVFMKPEIDYVDRIVDLTPFETGSPTLQTAAELVIRELGLPRGKPKHNQRTQKGDAERGKQLNENLNDYLRELEDNRDEV